MSLKTNLSPKYIAQNESFAEIYRSKRICHRNMSLKMNMSLKYETQKRIRHRNIPLITNVSPKYVAQNEYVTEIYRSKRICQWNLSLKTNMSLEYVTENENVTKICHSTNMSLQHAFQNDIFDSNKKNSKRASRTYFTQNEYVTEMCHSKWICASGTYFTPAPPNQSWQAMN